MQREQYQKNLASYEQILLAAVRRQFPLSDGDRHVLYRLEQALQLREEDVQAIQGQLLQFREENDQIIQSQAPQLRKEDVQAVQKHIKDISIRRRYQSKLSYQSLIIPLILLVTLIILVAIGFANSSLGVSLLISIIIYSFLSIKIVKEGTEALVERLGQYRRSLMPGLNIVIPFIDTVLVETTREQLQDISSQLCITKDGIPLDINVIIFWRILDIFRAYYGIENLEEALANIIRSKLSTEIGYLELEQVFSSRDGVNAALLNELDEVTQSWGAKVIRVEIQEIHLAKVVLGEVPDMIELTFYNGIDWSAFKYSFNLVIENEGVELKVQGIEDKGNGELVVRVKVPF
ncbi:paraslipin [Kovacikia minuta CCNUW1]|uniref:SPFH domain-containing protein n=1 Tax=Kovacikia minuta TaxID=2931930 RepID=UPI001CCA1657|nr:paraslipin [Kovacikia minuta]UBF24112.1 paraslipin [Kovacikia minuta CCNUW1]